MAAFTRRYGRAPSRLEQHQLGEQATLSTRKAKTHHGETAAQQLDRWEAMTRRVVDGGLTEVAHTVVRRAQQQQPPAVWSEDDVIARAMASLEDRASSSESDVMKAISDALPRQPRCHPGAGAGAADRIDPACPGSG